MTGSQPISKVLRLIADEARLNIDGKLLGVTQDASLLLTDFPVATLQPLFKRIPGLENAAPASPRLPGPA